MAGAVSQGAADFASAVANMLDSDELRADASKWLLSFERSAGAWGIAFEVLQSDAAMPARVQLYAAQTLRKKTTFFFHELASTAERESLRQSVIELMHRHASSRSLLTQLSTVLATIAVHMDEWETPVADAWAHFAREETASIGSLCLPLFLEMLPETLGDQRMPVAQARISHLHAYVVANSSPAHEMLKQLFGALSGNEERSRVLRAFAAWIRWGEFEHAEMQTSSLVAACFASVAEAESPLRDDALSVLHELVVVLFQSPEDIGDAPLTIAMYEAMMAVRPALSDAVARGDEEHALQLARLLCEFGRATADFCIATSDTSVFGFLLEIASGPREVAFAALPYFAHFMSELVRVEDAHLYDEGFVHLLAVVAGQCALTGADREPEEVLHFRNDAFVAIRDIVPGLQPSLVLTSLVAQLGAESDELAAGRAPAMRTEGVLYALHAAAGVLHSIARDDLVGLVARVIELPTAEKLTRTALELLGALAKHFDLNCGPLTPALDETVVTLAGYELGALAVPAFAPQAALAFQALCAHAPAALLDRFEQVLDTMRTVVMVPGVEAGVQVFFCGAIGHLIGAAAVDSAPDALAAVTTPVLDELSALVATVSADPSRVGELWRAARHCIDLLKMLVLTATRPVPTACEPPMLHLMAAAWPVVQGALIQFRDIEPFCEVVCDGFLKNVLRAVDRHLAPLFGSLVDTLLDLLASSPFSCFVYLASLLMATFAADTSAASHVLALYSGVSMLCFSYFGQDDGFARYPDLVMEFFEATIKLLRRVPRMVIQPETPEFLDSLVRCALAGRLVDHMNGSRAIVAFFEALLIALSVGLELPSADAPSTLLQRLPRDALPFLQNAFDNHCAEIVHALVELALDRFMRMAAELTAVFVYFVRLVPAELMASWIAAALAVVPDDLLSELNKRDFAARLLAPPPPGESIISPVRMALLELSGLYRTRLRAALGDTGND